MQLCYTDESKELDKTCEELHFRHDTSVPYCPQMNGIAEASVRRVKEGTSALLFQSWLEYKYWPEAMRCWCVSHNFFDVNREGACAHITPYRAKFKEDVWKLHPRIVDLPFGCACEFLPLGKKLKKRQKKFGKKTAEGIFMGFKVNSGLAWGEGYLVMDARTFQDTPANVKCHIYCVKDIAALDKCTFPAREGSWKPKMPSLDAVPEGQILEDEDGITSEVTPKTTTYPLPLQKRMRSMSGKTLRTK